MTEFKFLHSNTNKPNFLNEILEYYLNDLNDIVLELIDYTSTSKVDTLNGTYHLTNISYQGEQIYVRAVCYPLDLPHLMFRLTTFPGEVNAVGLKSFPLRIS